MLKIIVSSLLIWWVLKQVDWQAAFDQLQQLSMVTVVGAFAIMLLVLGVLAARWWQLCLGLQLKLNYLYCYKLYLIGQVFMQILPGAVGSDIARGGALWRKGVTPLEAANSVVIDRLFGLLGLLSMVILAMPWVLRQTLGDDFYVSLIISGFVIIGVFVGFIFAPQIIRFFVKYFRFLSGFLTLADKLEALFKNKSNIFKAYGLALVNQFLNPLMVWIVAKDMGYDLSFTGLLAIMPVSLFIAALPISIAGWGIREASLVFGLGLIGLDGEPASILALMFGLINFISFVPGAVLLLIASVRKKAIRT